MRVVEAAEVHRRLPWPALLDAIADALAHADEHGAPERWVVPVSAQPETEQTLLVMPAWRHGRLSGVKVVQHVPGNERRGIPTVHAMYLAFDGASGAPLAVIDGDALTVRRTAAVAALGSRALARPDARRLLLVGTGELAPLVAAAHAESVGVDSITVWGRSPSRSATTVERIQQLVSPSVRVDNTDDLDAAAGTADVIATATGSTGPLVLGRHVSPGAHISLMGSFKPDMRETDSELIAAASVFVDSRAGAMHSGDLAQPLAAGELDESAILADLADLVCGRHPGRRHHDEITVFKSVGFALADLAAARLVLDTDSDPD